MNNFFKKFKDVEEQKQAELEVEESSASLLEKLLSQNGHRAVLVMSYNSIDNYQTGIYGNGRLIVLARHLNERDGNPKENKETIIQQFKDQFDIADLLNIDGLIEHVFVYIGGASDGKKGNLMAAVEIAGSLDNVSIYHCDCTTHHSVQNLARGICDSASITEIDCGGQSGMSRVCQRYAQPEEKNDK